MSKPKMYKVKVKPLNTIAEYLHNLCGVVIKAKRVTIFKRLKRHGWNPVKIGVEEQILVSFAKSRKSELKHSSKKFWFTKDQLYVLQ